MGSRSYTSEAASALEEGSASKKQCVESLASTSSGDGKLRITNPEKFSSLADLVSPSGSSSSPLLSSPSAKFPVPVWSPRLFLPAVPMVENVQAPTPSDMLQKHTVLHEMIEERRLEGFDQALECMGKEEIDACNPEGYSALLTAAACSDPELSCSFCTKLIAKNADVHTVDHEGFSALHWAAAVGNTETIALLIKHGANVHAQSNTLGDTPLHRASRFGQVACLTALMRTHGASPLVKNSQGDSPIDVAGNYCNNRALTGKLKPKVLKAFYDTDPRLKTLILYHEDCLEHRTSSAHQEAPERLTAIYEKLKKTLDASSYHVSTNFSASTKEQLAFCHEPKYIDFVFDLHKKVAASGNPVPFTPRVQEMNGVEQDKVKADVGCDTFFSKGSLPAALRAVGAVTNAVDRVIRGHNRNAFCLVRPPGHHAGPSGLLQNAVSCGFCIFNAVAVAARHALSTYSEKVQRIAIVDFDVHHGNGTEEIVRSKFQDPSSVFFFSIHLYDKPKDALGSGEFYPGSGKEDAPEYNIMNEPLVPLWKMPTCRTRAKARSKTGSDSLLPVVDVGSTDKGSIGTRARASRSNHKSSDNNDSTTSTDSASEKADSGAGTSSSASSTASTSSVDSPKADSGPESTPKLYGRLAFRQSIVERLLPALERFSPDLIFISAGFDAGKNDIGCSKTEKGKSLSGIDLLPEDYLWVTKEIQRVAKKTCDGRIVSVLEGGYGQWARSKPSGPGAARKVVLNRDQLAENAVAHVKGLCL